MRREAWTGAVVVKSLTTPGGRTGGEQWLQLDHSLGGTVQVPAADVHVDLPSPHPLGPHLLPPLLPHLPLGQRRNWLKIILGK